MKDKIQLTKYSVKIVSLCMVFILVLSLLNISMADETIPEANERGWVDFFLICNEGMKNDGGNAGNTLMVVSMNPSTGMIKLMPFTWDTFVQYKGYDVPQKIDMPFRNNGPEETMEVFNDNFNMDIKLFMSLNFLNLANLIDEYGGVTVDVSIAERNAINQMVSSKKEDLLIQAERGLVTQAYIENLASEYYLNEYGPETHLNGMQAVGFGWLQYDSVYNCCIRDVEVIKALFSSVGKTIGERVVLYTNESGKPENKEGRRLINLDEMTEEDQVFLRNEMAPIFRMAYHNLSEKDILDISNALARTAYQASRQGVNVFDSVKYKVLPLEATKPYDLIAGTEGHIVDYEANEQAIKEFLFSEEDF